MSLPARPLPERTRFQRAWEVVSDLVIATALIWAIPLLLAAALAIVKLLQQAI